MRFWNILLSISIIAAAGLGLFVLSGSAKNLSATSLEARLFVQDFPVPKNFGIEPNSVAEFMADKLKKRIDEDLGIRLTLKADVVKQMKEIAMPRLMNVVVVKAMMRDIPELSAILGSTLLFGVVSLIFPILSSSHNRKNTRYKKSNVS